MQRLADSPGSRTMSPPHTGQCAGMLNGLRLRGVRLDAHHFRDNVAAPLDHDCVADLQSEAFDLIFVMQGGACDHDAADRIQVSGCATGVNAPVRPTCTSMFTTSVSACRAGYLKAIAHRGAFGCIAERLLLRPGIHLRYNAVNFVRKLVAACSHSRQNASSPARSSQTASIGIDLEPNRRRGLKRFPVAVRGGDSLHQQASKRSIRAAGWR